MKRLILGIVLLLASTAALAQTREVLLTPDGTLYTIEVVAPDATEQAGIFHLQLTARQGKVVTTTNLPESMSGLNIEPALAYDTDTQSLFVFWLHRSEYSSANELNLASYQNGKWQPAVAIDSRPAIFQARFNLRIGVTHHVAQLQKDGSFLDVPALLVHAVWWEDNSVDGEAARYSLISIEKGVAAKPEVHALRELVDAQAPAEVSPGFNRDFLRHPSLVETASPDSIDVVFGDTLTNVLNRITLKPVADAHIHIPVGTRGGNPINVPKVFSNDWSGDVTTLDGRDGRMVFTNTTATRVSYMMYTNGSWAPLKTIAIDDKITVDAAMAAVAKMLASQ